VNHDGHLGLKATRMARANHSISSEFGKSRDRLRWRLDIIENWLCLQHWIDPSSEA
jgi:hypothetical protein